MSFLPPFRRRRQHLQWSVSLRYALLATLLAFVHINPVAAQLFQGILTKADRSTNTQPHPSVARIVVPDKNSVSFGSGSLVDVRDNVGLVITNWHVVNEAGESIQVIFPDGFQSPARILKTDKDWDLAALAIWKPSAPPIPLATTVPRPGDPLSIAGYGSGNWRLSHGKCTQYVAPAENMPYEMVEVSTEARQGDSGGPIFNVRGELAGVLFGASRGTTSGSYAGRVRQFLEPIITGAESSAPQAIAAKSGSGNLGMAAAEIMTESPAVLKPPPTTERPSKKPVDDLAKKDEPPHEESSARISPTTPQTQDAPALPPDESIIPRSPAVNSADDDPRFTIRSGAGGLQAIERRDLADRGLVYTPLPPRGRSSVGISTSVNPPSLTTHTSGDPYANIWQQIAGQTAFDQGKTILAALGLLTLVYRFMGRESSSESDGEE